MKVKCAERALGSTEAEIPVAGRREVSFRNPSFERQFNAESREQAQRHLEELKNRLEEQGKKLTQRVDLGEFSRYRALISEILCEVVGSAFAYQKENGFDRRGRHSVYATVRKINEKLEELAGEILENNRNEIEILARIDEIRGLLLDILM